MANPIVASELIGVSGIYALIDPTDGTVGYVGKSKDIAQRYSQHIDSMGSDRKSAWIADLADQDMRPELKLLEKCGEDIINAREDYWLTFYLDAGEAIYNESKKLKCATQKQRESYRRFTFRMDWATAAALDAIVFLGRNGSRTDATLEAMIWQHIADRHRDDYDLFKVMLRKRGFDFNAELAKRT